MILVQLPPLAAHRRHWYAEERGGVPSHDPSLAVSTLPSRAVPLMLGRAVFEGARAATIADAALVALEEPCEFVAATRTRIRLPTSAATST